LGEALLLLVLLSDCNTVTAIPPSLAFAKEAQIFLSMNMSLQRIYQRHNLISSAAGTSAPTEAGFNQSEEVIGAFFNSATVGFALVDTQLRFVALNEALAQMNGVPLKHHLGKQVRQVLGEAAQKIEPVFRRVLTTARAAHNVQITALLPTRNQVGQWLESYFPVSDKNGTLTHVGATVVEVTSPSAVSDWSLTCEAAAKSTKPGMRLGSTLFGGSTPSISDLISRTSKLRRRSRGEFFVCRANRLPHYSYSKVVA
jgi:transcriptional regulator with PAS, ATPase and Fis domain